MILDKKILSMAESKEYFGDHSENEEIMKGFAKKLGKLSPKDGKAMRKRLEELDMLKIRDEHIAKIIDLLPDNKEDLNKIFSDVGLDEDETKKILDTVKEFS